MYCPNCGSNNQPDLKFCTRCGTNLSAVSDALSGKAAGTGVQIDERVAKLIKDYYKGRRDTITGLVLIPAAVKAMLLLILFGMPPIPSFFIVSWMMFWGVAALAGGLGKWIASGGEMRALGHQPPKSKLWGRAARMLAPSPAPEAARITNEFSTGPVSTPIAIPASVTEETTRTLEERAHPPKQTQ
ncbi:MAG TPA: zinc ribbon domain-containing protein [Blastocatellia bacterium]|nr:zinc ribbon domain-containing protein [Blastocatellia bacterium]